MTCVRRVGRPGFAETVEAFDASRGGITFQFAGDLAPGDTVLLQLPGDARAVELEGRVADVSRWGSGAAAHIAFTGGATDDVLGRLLHEPTRSG